jgi:steroid delta-isomerase-like uncharacterized protein
MPQRLPDGERLVRHWYEELFNHQNLGAVDDLVSPDFIQHVPGGPTQHGADKLKEFLGWYSSTFADASWTIEDVIAAGDKVVVRASGESTYVGGWHGIPARGERVKESCINIFRVSDGKIREMWFEASDLHVAHQLNAFPPVSRFG